MIVIWVVVAVVCAALIGYALGRINGFNEAERIEKTRQLRKRVRDFRQRMEG